MTLHSEIETLTPRKLIETLATRIYDPPLSEARERMFAVPSALRVVVLVLDFDTEVNMQGILGFLEKSTGLYLAETIEAFQQIGAKATANTLENIHEILESHGVSASKLRSDFDGTAIYAITSFNELHGDLGSLPEEVEREAEKLYVYSQQGRGEDVWALLDSFVDANRPSLLAEVARVCNT